MKKLTAVVLSLATAILMGCGNPSGPTSIDLTGKWVFSFTEGNLTQTDTVVMVQSNDSVYSAYFGSYVGIIHNRNIRWDDNTGDAVVGIIHSNQYVNGVMLTNAYADTAGTWKMVR